MTVSGTVKVVVNAIAAIAERLGEEKVEESTPGSEAQPAQEEGAAESPAGADGQVYVTEKKKQPKPHTTHIFFSFFSRQNSQKLKIFFL